MGTIWKKRINGETPGKNTKQKFVFVIAISKKYLKSMLIFKGLMLLYTQHPVKKASGVGGDNLARV